MRTHECIHVHVHALECVCMNLCMRLRILVLCICLCMRKHGVGTCKCMRVLAHSYAWMLACLFVYMCVMLRTPSVHMTVHACVCMHMSVYEFVRACAYARTCVCVH